MKKDVSFFSKFSPKKIIYKLKKTFSVIFKRNIDVSTEEGRKEKRQQAIALTSVIASIAKIIALLVPLITIRVSRRYLGEEIYGLWSSVNSFFAVFAFADLGLGSGLQTNLSKATGKDNNEEECQRLISSTFIMLFSVAGIIIFLFLGIYNFIDWASLVGAKDSEAISLAGLVFMAIIIPKMLDVPLALTQRTQVALQEGYNYYIWAIVGSALSLGSVYLNAYVGSPKIILILCSAAIPTIVSLLNFIYYFCFTKRRMFFPKFKYFNLNTCKTMLTMGIGFLIIHVLMNIGLSHMDSFIVGKIDSLSFAGDYSICLKVAAIVNVIANMFGVPLWGVYGEALSRGDVGYVKKHVVKQSIFMLGITLFASLCGMLLAPIAFDIVVGKDFTYNPLTLLGMFLLQCIFAGVNPFFMILNGTGDVKTQIVAYGIFAPFSFILKWLLAPVFSANIMPWITAISFLVIMYPLIITKAFKVIKKYENRNNESNDEYKFVVTKPHYGDVYNYCYKDIENLENVDLLNDYLCVKSNFVRKLHSKHFTKRYKLPFKGIWNSQYFKTKFDKDNKLIFIMDKTNVEIFKYGVISYLRKKHKKAKFVLFMSDLVEKSFVNLNFDKISKDFDAIVSFDYNDCEKYNLINHPLVYSAPKELPNCEEDIDVYFCGRAKERLDLIMKTFNHLRNKGLNCLFILRDVPKEKRENIDGLIYLDSFMSYEQNLEYLKRAKCLLEIMQEGGNGYTLRTCEAIAYNKKILTNNLILKNADFYDENMMSFFVVPEDIDSNFIIKEKKKYKDNNYFSPKKLLEKVVYVLEKEDK